ncbi:MAG: AAA family ATPase [Chlorobi bacterium]|nr:AAA family ATPase [Chlorobiota bacterium]
MLPDDSSVMFQQFLRRGVLPFVGRQAELARILNFWQATPEAGRLRAGLVLAEAGVGKSRLLEEAMTQIEGASGAVIHAKFYPEGTNQLGPLLAQSIGASGAGGALLRGVVEGTRPAVIAALRRIGRLRPVLLVLEDIHLIDPESAGELATLLDALADETLSILALARPTELRVRPILERYLVERIDLQRLDRDAIGAMWLALFATPADAGAITLLDDLTQGNALALRSCIRSAVESGALRKGRDGVWGFDDSPQTLRTTLRQTVALLAEGMVLHLTPAERHAAERLAWLGEVFSIEAARQMLGDADSTLQELTRKGITTTTAVSVRPLAGVAPKPGREHVPYPTSAAPLVAFTHTLLHRHLVESSLPDPDLLVALLESVTPLYSLLPLVLLGQTIPRCMVDTQRMFAAAERARYIAWMYNSVEDSESGIRALETAEAIAAHCRNAFDPNLQMRWERNLLLHRVSLTRRRFDDEFRAAAQRLYHLTTEHPTEPTVRLDVLMFYLNARHDAETAWAVWEEVQQIYQQHPEVAGTGQFQNALSVVANQATAVADTALLGACTTLTQDLLNSSELSDELKSAIQKRIFPTLLALYSTPDELASRMEMFTRLEEETANHNDHERFHIRRLSFLAHTGQLREVLARAGDAVRIYTDRGDWHPALYCMMDRLLALAAFGEPLPNIANAFYRLCDQTPIPIEDHDRMNFSQWGTAIGLLRMEPEWASAMAQHALKGIEYPIPSALIATACSDWPLAASRFQQPWPPQLIITREAWQTLRDAATLLANPAQPADVASILQQLCQLLRRPITRLYDLLSITSGLRLAQQLGPDATAQGMDTAMAEAVAHAIEAVAGWLCQRELAGFARPFFQEFGAILQADQQRGIEKEIAEIEKRWQLESARNSSARPLKISMIGKIAVEGEDGTMTPLRGGRIKLVLALMVADVMIDRRLNHREFVQLAGGDEDGDDMELARKKRNMTIARIREAIGTEAIITGGETPVLNLERVEVDILRADSLLRRTLAALRERSLVRAYPLLREALELARGDVPFPSLYDPFFEAVREDFEFRLRSAILAVGRGLLAEGDAAAAETILRRGYMALPEDEEIGDFLREALIAQGKHVEAERLKAMAEG